MEDNGDVQLAAVALFIAAVGQSGDFLARRTMEQVWPRLDLLLQDASGNGGAPTSGGGLAKPLQRFSAVHRAHCAAFQAARAMIEHLRPPGRVLRAMARSAVRALAAPSTHDDVAAEASAMLAALARHDPDVVWYALRRSTVDLGHGPPTSAALAAQWRALSAGAQQ